MFDEKYLALNNSDKSDFALSINHLLSHSFVVRDIFDSKEKIIRINPYYRFLNRHFDVADEYLSYMGYSIEKDSLLGVITLFNKDNDNRIKIDRETSLILYVLRLIYENEKSDSSSNSQGVYLSTPMLIKSMIDFSVSFPNKKITGRLVGKSLRFLANHNLITKVSGTYDEGNVTFYILPSIVYAIDSTKIQAMSDTIDKINQESKNINLNQIEGDF
ncbi:MAG: DUF4194 domain-containing protein [Bacilli bacterium]